MSGTPATPARHALLSGRRGPATATAVVAVVLIIATDLVLDRERIAIGTLVLPVIVSAATLSPRRTAAISVFAAAGALFVLAAEPSPSGSLPLLRFAVLVIGCGACVWAADRGAAAQVGARETAEHEQRYRTILDTSDEGIGVIDTAGRVVFANRRLAEILGVPAEEMLGRPATEVVSGASRDALMTRIARYRSGHRAGYEVRHRRPDGELVHLRVSGRPIYDADGRETGMVGVYSDITPRKRAEQELLRMSLYDELTGLANRALLVDRLGHELARRDRSTVAVLMLDLDQFKAVNDALGHGPGDLLLQQVARRLLEVVRPFDTVARLGGDEFVLVCSDIDDAEAAAAVARRIETVLARPMELAGIEVTVTASIGLALARPPVRGTETDQAVLAELPDQLLREADAAMYAAKRRGRARFEVYEASMGEQASSRLRTLNELRSGLGRGELRLFYQPIIDITDGSTRGVESLIRWQHPDRGLLLPGEFLPVAEESGLLVDVGDWVLRAASQQGARWQQERPLSISVNLSVRQLLHRDLVSQVRSLLDESGLPPERLTLEVTETALIADLNAASKVLEQLRECGVRVALDDFGTGYSSLAYLRNLPVDELKLDRSFLVDLEEPTSLAVVAAVIDVAHALDMLVVGEGVEHEAQLATLSRLGCDLAQGFLCGRPAAPADLRTS